MKKTYLGLLKETLKGINRHCDIKLKRRRFSVISNLDRFIWVGGLGVSDLVLLGKYDLPFLAIKKDGFWFVDLTYCYKKLLNNEQFYLTPTLTDKTMSSVLFYNYNIYSISTDRWVLLNGKVSEIDEFKGINFLIWLIHLHVKTNGYYNLDFIIVPWGLSFKDGFLTHILYDEGDALTLEFVFKILPKLKKAVISKGEDFQITESRLASGMVRTKTQLNNLIDYFLKN